MPENADKPKVLVADDERVIADTLAMILNQSGFVARAVYSGEKALELATTFAPDMLICDVIMADLNGIEQSLTTHAAAIDSARTAMAQTDDLVERVVEALELLQTSVLDQHEERAALID